MRHKGKLALMSSVMLMLATAAIAADIGFPRPRIFPESITSTRAGDLYVSGADDGAIWQARSGDAMATEWLSPARSGMVAMFGVYADEKTRTLWACGRPRSGDAEDVRDRASSLFAYDLVTGALKGRWQMPGGAKDVCNDMAIGRDGALYIAETGGGRIVRLRKGASALDVWYTDGRLKGVDGIAFDTDSRLYLSTVSTSRAFRLPLSKHGDPGTLTELTPSRPLDHPDGMRFMAPGYFLFGENGEHGGISEAVVKGDMLEIRTLTDSRPGTTSAVLYKDRVYGVVAKLRYRVPAMAGLDPGPFAIYSVPLK